MSFALYPAGGLPRLWRYVDDADMTADGIVCRLDPEKNLLIINRPLFDQLPVSHQNVVLRTHSRVEFI